jgi:hypothetical protein
MADIGADIDHGVTRLQFAQQIRSSSSSKKTPHQ